MPLSSIFLFDGEKRSKRAWAKLMRDGILLSREREEEEGTTFSAAQARTQGEGERETGEMKRVRESSREGKGGKTKGW